MTNMQKYLDHAFNVLSCVSVKGDDVEKMAEVRATLRKAYQLEDEESKEEGKDNG